MDLNNIRLARLQNQQICRQSFKTTCDLATWMGAMQAQNYGMMKWALGIRLPNAALMEVTKALNEGHILRTHLMRPTWHIVSATDIRWIIELTATQILSGLKSRHKELELTKNLLLKTNKIIVKAIEKNGHQTRDELIVEFEKANISLDNNRAAHFFMIAELEGLICSGIEKNNKTTYALLEERVPEKKTLSRDEAVAKLAYKYFHSHAPATLKDFIWWSGLTVKDARQGLESNKSKLISEKTNLGTFWFPADFIFNNPPETDVFLLPAFDEFIISYKNRDLVLSSTNFAKSISSNGVFRPVIVINGKVTGTWKQVIKKDQIIIETELLRKHSKEEIASLESFGQKLGKFYNKQAVIKNDVVLKVI